MEFGLHFEMEMPRPWNDRSEYNIYWQALEQIELGDRLGFDFVWEVEHHFLEEYSHSSAPEVFFGAVSQRTKNIRIAHGVRLLPFQFNHPIKVAEQAAVLDIISNGRVEFGLGAPRPSRNWTASASITSARAKRSGKPPKLSSRRGPKTSSSMTAS